jgi:hypothetical protein
MLRMHIVKLTSQEIISRAETRYSCCKSRDRYLAVDSRHMLRSQDPCNMPPPPSNVDVFVGPYIFHSAQSRRSNMTTVSKRIASVFGARKIILLFSSTFTVRYHRSFALIVPSPLISSQLAVCC